MNNRRPENESSKKADPRSATDAELVFAVRRGDKRAFVEIVARHQAMVCGVAFGILGDFSASEDAGQEAFLTAWRKMHELREPARLRAWLGQIARNAALGQLRRKRGEDSLDEAQDLPDDARRPDESAVNQEEAAMVRASLAELPEVYRLPLILYYREDQSVRGVAETLGLSEDAVKQRLARGREMLRERMSGLIETVLGQTKPTAVFTMSIAAAIGALAAPAAIAGTIFGAAAASTAPAATVATTPIFTAMSTSKSLLVATALVATVFVPIGYQIGTNREPEPSTNALPQIPLVTNAAPERRTPTFEGSALFAEWRDLHERHGTTAEAMPVLFNAIRELKDPFRRRAFHAALIAEWVQLDPKAGLKFMLGKGPDATQRRQFFDEWLALDARGAVDALTSAGAGWETIAREALPAIAKQVPSAVGAIATRLPKTDNYWDTTVRDAFAVLADSDLKWARSTAESVHGPNREQALAGIAKAWGKSDLSSAVAWAKALPEGIDRDEVIRAALLGKATVDPAAALESVGIVPAGGKHAYFATTTGARVLAEAAKSNFDAAVDFLAQNPGRFGHEDLMGLARPVTERLNADPSGFLSTLADNGSLKSLAPAIGSALLNDSAGQRAAVWDWLKMQPESEGAKALRQNVLSSAGYQDPALAMRLVEDLPLTPEGNQQVETVATSLLNGGSMLHRFDKLLQEAPERLRQPLIDSAFRYLRGETLADPQVWINRLSLLPETSRALGAECIARAWTEQTPEEAIGWVTTLPSGDARNSASAAVASTWARKDAYQAAEWVASMPSGKERDRSAASLALTLADQYPQQAWEWALSINDDHEKTRAATHAARMMASRDAATARRWIDSAPLSAQQKAELQAAIEKGRFQVQP